MLRRWRIRGAIRVENGLIYKRDLSLVVSKESHLGNADRRTWPKMGARPVKAVDVVVSILREAAAPMTEDEILKAFASFRKRGDAAFLEVSSPQT